MKGLRYEKPDTKSRPMKTVDFSRDHLRVFSCAVKTLVQKSHVIDVGH